MNRLERLAYSLPEPVRRALFRNGVVRRLRNRVTRTVVAEMAAPLAGYLMRLPHDYVRSYGVVPVEPDAVAFIQRVVRRGWVLADVGAFAGYYSLRLARLVGHGGAVHAFEPVLENFQMLEFNLRLNHSGNVRANQLAVAAADGEAAFRRFRGLQIPYGTLVSQPDASRYAAIPTKVRSVDSYLADLGWPRLFLIDAGYEMFSLQDDPGLERPITRPDAWNRHKHCAAVHRSR